MAKAKLFRGLPQNVIEDIVDRLTEDFYLENDVLARFGMICDGVHIVAYGTVAVYDESGKEVLHLNDGYNYGILAMLLNDNLFLYNHVAVTHCHVYKLERAHFIDCMKKYPTFRKMISEEADFLEGTHRKRQTHIDHELNVINQLKEKMILEHLHHRH